MSARPRAQQTTPDHGRHGPSTGVGDGAAGYRQAVRAEWTRFRSVRAPRTLTALMAVALPAVAVLVAATGSLQPDDTILGASVLPGAVLVQIVAAVLGAGMITTEFRTGTIGSTVTACPRRSVVLAAKATIVAAVTVTVAGASATSAFVVGASLLDRRAHATGEPWPALVGVALAVAAIGVLGLGLGTLIRQPAGAASTAIGAVLLPGLLAPLLGDAQRWLGGASASGVMQKLTQSSDAAPETVGSLGAWPSLGLLLLVAATVLLAGLLVFRRRDI